MRLTTPFDLEHDVALAMDEIMRRNKPSKMRKRKTLRRAFLRGSTPHLIWGKKKKAKQDAWLSPQIIIDHLKSITTVLNAFQLIDKSKYMKIVNTNLAYIQNAHILQTVITTVKLLL